MDEWTFEQARKHWQPMTRAVQHVGVPGYQFQAGVFWDGAVVFGPLGFRELNVMKQETAPLGDHLLHLSIGFGQRMHFVDRKGTGHPAIERWLDGGRLPIPHVETKDGDLAWHETVFAHLLGRSLEDGMTPQPDDVLVVHVSFKARNAGLSKRTGHMWLHFGETSHVRFGYKARMANDVAAAIPHQYEAPYGLVGDKVRYVLPTPNKGKLRWHDRLEMADGSAITRPQRVIEWEVPLEAGEEAELKLVLPFGLVERAVADELAKLDGDGMLQTVRGFWTKLLYGPGQITTPDPFINDYLAAVAGQMAEQVGQRIHSTKVWMYKTSPNHYEGYWPCNAAKALPTFDLRGLAGINRPVLQSFIDVQTADVGGLERDSMGHGAKVESDGYAAVPGFMGNFGEWTANPLTISHGLGMWALASHYRVTRDRQWLGEGPGSRLEALLIAFDWITAQRRRTMRETDGKKVPQWGLLPAASAHDWLAGTAISNDISCIYGMIEVVRLLREIGHPRAEETAKELADYRACLRERYIEARDKAPRVPLADGTTIPFVPRMVEELDWKQPDWTYTTLGPLRAEVWGGFDPHDPLVDEALAFTEAGAPAGQGWSFAGDIQANADTADRNFADVGDPGKERHWLWRHYVEYETMWPLGGHLFLDRDDLPRFFEFLTNNMAIVLHREWRVGVESLDGTPSNAPGDGDRWQIFRKMFIHERGGYDGSQQELFLLQALPREWLQRGYGMCVTNMGTWFGGNVNLDIRMAVDGESVKVQAKLSDLAVTPKEIRMRLRSGDGRPLASATINGHAVAVLPGDTIMLPLAKSGDYHIEGRFS